MCQKAFLLLAAGFVFALSVTGHAQSQLAPCPSSLKVRWHNCFGSYTYPSGDKYVGEWHEDQKSGKGTYTWSDDDSYVGEFRDDRKHGQGTYTYSDGAKYVGDYRDGERHGYGTELSPSGSVVRNGFWQLGTYIGTDRPPWYAPQSR